MMYAYGMSAPIPLAASVDLSGSWSTFWSAITAAAPQLTGFMSVLGVAILIFSLAAYLWNRMRRQGAGDSGRVIWAVVVGATLAAPGVLFPLMLGLADMIANAAIGIWVATGG